MVFCFLFFFKQRSQYQPIKDVYAVAEREACAGWTSSGLVLLIKLYLLPAAVFVQASCLDGRDQVSRELGLSDLDLNRKSPLLLELVRRGRHRDKTASLAEVRQTSWGWGCQWSDEELLMECVRVRAGRPRREHSQDERTSPSLCVCVCVGVFVCRCVCLCGLFWVMMSVDGGFWFPVDLRVS